MSYGGYGGYQGGGYGGTSYTSYGAQGDNDGGGFMMGGSQDASQSAARDYDKDTLRPVTILQILTAEHPHPSADFKISGVDVTHICFVGQINNLSKQSTRHVYQLHDGTGHFEVSNFDLAGSANDLADDDQYQQKEAFPEQSWVKVWGKLKEVGGKTQVGPLTGMKAIKDLNEVNLHLLESTAAHLYCTRGPPEQFKADGAANGQMQGVEHGGAAGGGGAGAGVPGLSSVAKKVLQTMANTPQGGEGLHMQMIAQASGLSLQEVAKGGDELINHSLIFTTVDDNTWAILEG